MASPRVVITEVNGDTPAVGGLFEGVAFFLVQRLPSRASFVQKIQSNGGRVVKLEGQADYIVADHFRKDCPPSSISYTFIDNAIRDGALPDPNEHTAGPPPGAVREAGSGVPGKSTRTPFTAEDDRVLWQWVERCKDDGALIKGNEIYKQLEAKNARHTYQAWRDRYVKRLIDKPPAGVEVKVAANAPPSPPTAQDEQRDIATRTATPNKPGQAPTQNADLKFTKEELENLIGQGHDIMKILDEWKDEAWQKWALVYPQHSAHSWQRFWEEEARVIYLQRDSEQTLENATEDVAQATVEEGTEEAAELATEEAVQKVAEEAAEVQKDDMQRQERPVMLERTGQSPAVSNPNEDKSSSPVSAKRRLDEMRSRHRAESGRKKQKIDTSVLLEQTRDQAKGTQAANEQPLARLSTQPIEKPSSDNEQAVSEQVLPASELHSDAQAQPAREHHLRAEDALLTSELNREAQAQFDEEVLGIPRTGEDLTTVPVSNLPTSNINPAADQQIRRESLDRQDDVSEDEDDGNKKEESLSATSELLSEEVSRGQVAVDTQVNLTEVGGDALTEANLANQQAQHKAQLLRGTDLPEDNDVGDGAKQERYIEFLRGVTRQSSDLQGLQAPALPRREDTTAAVYGSELQSNMLDAGPAELEPAEVGELPMSSQQEIDDAMDDAIRWPESPQASQRKDPLLSPSQSLRFETQVSYPLLPQAQPRQQVEKMFSSQASLPDQIDYPSLPRQHLDRKSAKETQLEEPSPSPPPLMAQPPEYEESSYVLVEDERYPRSSQMIGEGDEVDLALPAPDGGWDLSSSPARVRHSSPARQVLSQQPALADSQLDVAKDPAINEEVAGEDNEIIEVSSSSSSSPSDSPSEVYVVEEESREDRRKILETQDIVDAETQQPDFDMPLPPESDVEDENLNSRSTSLSSPPPVTDIAQIQRNLAETQALPDDGVDSYINTMHLVHGYNEASIIAALKCTSMRPDLAELVLLDEKARKGLPEDVAGIWSEDEDRILESGYSKGLKELEDKHTWKECERRLRFLEWWREEE